MSQRPPIIRVTADDLMSLVSERGSTPLQVGAVLLLDVQNGFDPALVLDHLARRITAVPRLRQRLQNAPFGCGRPIWVDDLSFTIANHLTSLPCPAPGGEPAVLGLAAELIGVRLPRDRPLWAAALVTDTAQGKAALILVFHHVLADGIGGLAVLASLIDGAPDAADAGFPRPALSRTALAVDAAWGRIHSLRRLLAALGRLGSAAAELRPATRARGTPTSLNGPTGPRRAFAGVRAEVNEVHRVAHAHGATVNDVVLAAVAGALHRPLERRGGGTGVRDV